MKLVAKNQALANALLVLWAGGAALLSYSLVYALRKPYTAASFDQLTVCGMDYKVWVTTVQVVGYLIAKFIGIKLISELKPGNRFKFLAIAALCAEVSLIGFGLLNTPFNLLAMFANGLSLGCMWGVVFSFIEGRKITDMLASLLGVSIVFSAGFAKSIGLIAMQQFNLSPFWMPAAIGGIALPCLLGMGYLLQMLPQPTEEDIRLRSKRIALDHQGRKTLFLQFAPILSLIFFGNFLLVVLRDVKEDFLVEIIDMSQHSSWLFTRIDSIITISLLVLFGMFTWQRNNIKALMYMILLVVAGCLTMTWVSYNYRSMQLTATTWLFIQSSSLYIAYLTFQTIFFDRFIACFRVKGNVGFFISIIDFVGYAGTVSVLCFKELVGTDIQWFDFYNQLAFVVGGCCSVVFSVAGILIYKKYGMPTSDITSYSASLPPCTLAE